MQGENVEIIREQVTHPQNAKRQAERTRLSEFVRRRDSWLIITAVLVEAQVAVLCVLSRKRIAVSWG